jgi:NitT/TauT family transport system ATP-binding protein
MSLAGERHMMSKVRLERVSKSFAALDAQTRETLQDELLRIWEETGKTILFVTHGIDEAIYLGQRVAMMTTRPGRIFDIIDIPLSAGRCGGDAGSSPEFAGLRSRIRMMLHEKTDRFPTTSLALSPMRRALGDLFLGPYSVCFALREKPL